MLIQKIHCVTAKADKFDLNPRECPFLKTLSTCKHKTVTKWHYFKEIMAGLAWAG